MVSTARNRYLGALRKKDKKWEDIARRLPHLEKIFGLGKEDSHLTLRVDGKTEPLTPEQFIWIISTGSLEGDH
jgi:hypothetical protein